MSEPFLGEIRLVSFSFAPRGWALCAGQLLAINQNQALFALLGIQFGGNGQTSFALPNLQDRVPIHIGQGPGLTSRTIGDAGGSGSVTVTEANLPAHEHALFASTLPASQTSPAGAFLAAPSDALYGGSGAAGDFGPLAATGPIEESSHVNQQPFVGMSYIIALTGIFPSQN